MAKWQVWSEGFVTSGERDGATFHGEFEADTFAEACAAWAATSSSPHLFDPGRLTYWGCRMFCNEREARAAYG